MKERDKMPLKSGGAVDSENMRGRSNSGLISIGKTGPTTLYVGLNTNPAKVIKIGLAKFTRDATLTFASGENGAWGLIIVGNYLYFVTVTNPSIVKKVDLTTFTQIGSLTLNIGEYSGTCLASDGTYLYVGCDVGKIVKIDLSTFTRVGSITVNSGVGQVTSLTRHGDFLYATILTGVGNPSDLSKIDLTTFTEVTSFTVCDASMSYDSVVSGNYLYVAERWQTVYALGKIHKVDLTTFSKIDTLTLSEPRADALLIVGTYLYVGLGGIEKVIKVDLSTFSEVSTLDLDTGHYSDALATDGTHLYSGSYPSPTQAAKISRITIKTFSLLDSITLQSGENQVSRHGMIAI